MFFFVGHCKAGFQEDLILSFQLNRLTLYFTSNKCRQFDFLGYE